MNCRNGRLQGVAPKRREARFVRRVELECDPDLQQHFRAGGHMAPTRAILTPRLFPHQRRVELLIMTPGSFPYRLRGEMLQGGGPAA